MTRRADLISAALWGAFGTVVIVASWRLPRLEQMGINPWSVPGLTPGLIGAAIVLIALALALRALRDAPASGTQPSDETGIDPASSASLRRSALAALLCLAFAGISLGHGLPFVLEATLFVFVFVCVFSWRAWRAEGRWVRGVVSTLLVAVLSSSFIAWLFSAVFLVRLP
jgi:hypothetical protein